MPVVKRLRARLAGQAGFSLPEILTTLAIGSVVMLAGFTLLEVTMKRADEVEQRVEATQRGRMAMDTITRQLRSQVCLSSTVPPMAYGSASRASFYADLTAGTGLPPELHTLDFSGGEIREDVRVGTGTPPAITFPAQPSRSRTLIGNVSQDGATPIFRYYAFDSASPPRPSVELPVPLSASDLGLVARITIAYKALAPRGDDRIATTLHNEVYVRAADPNDPAPIPTCA